MILRRAFLRQGRQALAFQRTQVFSRFSSSETPTPTATATPTETIATAVRTPLQPASSELSTPVERVEPSGTGPNVAQTTWEKREAQRHVFHSLGSTVTNVYEPEDLIRKPPKPTEITLELLLANQTHLGHSTSRWNPQNSQYIFGIRDGIHIISLEVTAAYLRRAAKVVEEVAARGGLILFVGTRKGHKRPVVRAAELAKGCHLFERWIPGSLTNAQQILGHCEMKVVNALDQELPEFQHKLEDRAVLKPDLVVCLNPLENVVLLHECGLNNVPTVGIIDTDADATKVTYPIPANDDSLRSVALIAGILGRAGEAGQKRRLESARKGVVTYEPVDFTAQNKLMEQS